tara:strand:+ start:896 stop:1165 length:270 start_codon:yes stop_codon:yes gene_type:complete
MPLKPKTTQKQRDTLAKEEEPIPEQELESDLDSKTIELFTKQMIVWGFTDINEFASKIMESQIGEFIEGKKVTKLLLERSKFILSLNQS